eukprot:10915371-Alexandrium_andersonii.AAC.1
MAAGIALGTALAASFARSLTRARRAVNLTPQMSMTMKKLCTVMYSGTASLGTQSAPCSRASRVRRPGPPATRKA